MNKKEARMPLLNPLKIKGFCLLIGLFFSLIELQAQCNPPDQLPTVLCQEAPLTCLNDACYSTSDEDDEGQAGFCGSNTVVHNPQYFQVVPIADCIEIHIHVDGCVQGGTALQAALVTSCQWMPCPGAQVPCQDVLDCDPGTGVGGTMIIDACGLTPGVPLWLMIDGSSGSQCQYTVEFASGIFEPQIDEELETGEALPGIVCQGFDNLNMVVGPAINNAHGYFWVLEWSGEVVTSTLPQIEIDIANNAPAGMWEVCVQAFSGCDTTEIPFCFPVEIYEIDDVEKEPETFCPEEFPFSWNGETIGGPGDYMSTFETPDGCPYDSLWTVEEYPEVPVGEFSILHCLNENFDPYIYEGEEYNASGTYDLDYPGMGLNGCDSTAELILTLAGIDAFIELTCQNGEFVLQVQVQEVIPTNAILSYEWYDGGATPIYDNNPLLVLEGGCYEVIVTVETSEGNCSFALETFCFDADIFRPFPPELPHGDTLLCAQEGIFFCVEEDPFGDPLFYTWSGPPGVEVYDNGDGCVEMDFSFTQGGQVCVFAENECGEGPSTCFNVEIIESPVASISHVTDLCSGTSTVITFTGSASPNAQFIWDFDSPATLTGSGVGPYTVTWNITGDKVINLSVIEPGCDTATTSGIISVTNLLAPTINCSSTISSVTFDWNDVAGANGYLVTVGGNTIATATSSHSITNLPPGTVINMTLTVVSGGACPDIVLMSSCTAENCPPPVIELTGPDSLCLNAPAAVNLNASVNGAPGNGVWSGPGIINGGLGTFDPTVAGSGQHQLTYTVDIAGCPSSGSYLITVFDSITADFTLDPVICIDDLANLVYTGNAPSGAQYDFDFGTALIQSGSGQGPYQLSYSSPGNQTVRLQISENGCTSDIISHTVDVDQALVAPVVNCQSNTSTVTFTWTDNNPAGYIVNVLSGHVGVQNGTEISFGGLTPGNIVEIEIITNANGACPPRSDQFTCEARNCPMPLIAITPVNDICLYPGTSPIDLEAVVTNGNGVGDWSGPGTSTSGRFDPVAAGPGSHTIVFHYLDDDCDFNEDITINVYALPSAFISNTNLILTCTSGNLILDGSGSSGGTLQFDWTTSDGVFISGETTNMAEVGAPGTYQLLVIDAISGCADSMSVVVTKDENAPDADAGPDKIITCDSLVFILGGNSSSGANIIYTWSTADGTIVGATDGLFVRVNETGHYQIAVEDVSNGCITIDEAEVVIDTALAFITLVPGDTIDCNTALSSVDATLSQPVSNYDLIWSTSDGVISGSSTGDILSVSQGGTYTLLITNRNNGCSKSASAIVPESDEIIDAVDVDLTNVVCFGENNGTLTINSVTGGISPYTYQWSAGQGGANLSGLRPGDYTLTVSDQNGCSYIQVFTITEPPKVTADVGPDFTVASEDSVTINLITNLSPTSISSINWSGLNSVNCPNCPTLQFIASESGTIVAVVTDTAGCSALDSMRLIVNTPRLIFIPSVFSPNDDKSNDHFFISGRSNLVNIPFMKIFDRWGNQVFEGIDLTPGDEQDGWDGKFNDQYMLPGVYVFVAELEYESGDKETVKGGITVVR